MLHLKYTIEFFGASRSTQIIKLGIYSGKGFHSKISFTNSKKSVNYFHSVQMLNFNFVLEAKFYLIFSICCSYLPRFPQLFLFFFPAAFSVFRYCRDFSNLSQLVSLHNLANGKKGRKREALHHSEAELMFSPCIRRLLFLSTLPSSTTSFCILYVCIH